MKKLILLTLPLLANLFALKAYAQANTSLSNLTSPTAVNVDLLPGTKHTFDLGGEKFSWKSLYLSGGIYLEGSKFISNNGSYSAFIGKQSGQANSGSYNTGVGYEALFNNAGASYNTGTGFFALYSNISGINNTANGAQALLSNTTGYDNTSTGMNTLYYNTSGYYNTASGWEALYLNTTGFDNIANGVQALYSNTTGSNNTANGYQALYTNTIGYDNAVYGFDALYSNTTGFGNTADGDYTLKSNTTGFFNIAAGIYALFYNTIGDGNTATGFEALNSNDDGASNSAYGFDADVNSGNYDNSSAFGNSALITSSNQVRIGNNLVTSIGGYANWTNISDARVKKNIKENVPGLAFINLLKPLTYNYDLEAADKIVWPDGRPQPKGLQEPDQLKQLDAQAKQEKEQITYTGFLAQDVETAAKSIGYDFSGVDAPKNDKDLYGLRYAEFVVPLVKAVQELDASQKQEAKSQNDEMDSLKAEIEMLKSQVVNLQSGTSGGSKFQISNPKLQTAVLYQNLPNPFNQSTIIPFHIPQDCQDASIMITNTSSGEVVSVIPVSCNIDHAQINSGTLSSGNYSYSLFVNGKIIDTKQMIIQK